MVILIISIIILFIGLFLFYRAKGIKNIRLNQIEQSNKQIQSLNKQLLNLQKQKNIYQQTIKILHSDQKKLSDNIDDLQDKIKREKDNLSIYYTDIQNQSKKSFQNYINILENSYKTKEEEYNSQILELNIQREQVKKDLDQIKSVYQAATAAKLRQQENKEKWSFYKIRLTDKQATDISRLQEWKQNLYDPTIVSKIIWSTYILKPTSDLCNRVLGSKPVCGIYKITNKATGEIYIGQSINIAQRWKTHIKCGLGIDASSTNKLYNVMQHTGVWNFTFEVLQKCSRDKLNEKERFWIEMYQSNKVGLNVTKGNK